MRSRGRVHDVRSIFISDAQYPGILPVVMGFYAVAYGMLAAVLAARAAGTGRRVAAMIEGASLGFLGDGAGPDAMTDPTVRHRQNKQGDDVHGKGEPRNVQAFGPGGLEAGATRVLTGPLGKFAKGKNEDLRRGEDHSGEPSGEHVQVYPMAGHRVTGQRTADRQVAVQRRRNQHVGRRVHAEDLNVHDEPTYEVVPVKRKRHVPNQLR